MRRLRLLWVIPDFPRRGVSAARERFWALLTRLATRHDVRALVVADAEDVGREAELPPGLAGVRVVRRALVPTDDPLALLPPVVRWAYGDPALAIAVAEELARLPLDLAQFEFIECGQFMPEPRLPTILTVHQVGFAAVRPSWDADASPAVRAPRALYQHLRLLDFELRALGRAHHVVTMSAEDAARLRHFVPTLRTSVSPVGVDCREFRPGATPPAEPTDLLFVGHFHHPPNLDAVKFLVRDVRPRLGRPMRVRVVGHAAPAELHALPGIELLGAVPDVRPHLAAARIVVAPVRFGTGMRGKVLEAFAMARPVVTTSTGAEGLGATPGQHLLVADGADAFAAAIRRLVEEPALAEQLGREARRLAEDRFDWDAIAAAHEDIYERVLRDAAPPPRLSRSALEAPLAAACRPLGYWPGALAGGMLLAGRALRWYAGAWRR
jgi:glycosyltransferase involved in cell wall biosynthesis